MCRLRRRPWPPTAHNIRLIMTHVRLLTAQPMVVASSGRSPIGGPEEADTSRVWRVDPRYRWAGTGIWLPGQVRAYVLALGRAPDLIVTSRSHPMPAGVSVAKVLVGRTGVMCAAPPPRWSRWQSLWFVFCETASVASAHPQRADSNTSCCIHCGRHRHTGNPLLCHDCNGVRDHE